MVFEVDSSVKSTNIKWHVDFTLFYDFMLDGWMTNTHSDYKIIPSQQ